MKKQKGKKQKSNPKANRPKLPEQIQKAKDERDNLLKSQKIIKK